MDDATGRPSFAQERLWFLDQQEPGSAAYNLCWAHRLRGQLDVARLQECIDRLVQRHEALRSSFPAGPDGRPRLIVASQASAPLCVVDLRLRPGSPRPFAEGEARRPFDLAAGPLLRVSLAVVGPSEHVLVFVVHHIVFDGWSISIFHRELGEALWGCRRRKAPGSGAAAPVVPCDR